MPARPPMLSRASLLSMLATAVVDVVSVVAGGMAAGSIVERVVAGTGASDLDVNAALGDLIGRGLLEIVPPLSLCLDDMTWRPLYRVPPRRSRRRRRQVTSSLAGTSTVAAVGHNKAPPKKYKNTRKIKCKAKTEKQNVTASPATTATATSTEVVTMIEPTRTIVTSLAGMIQKKGAAATVTVNTVTSAAVAVATPVTAAADLNFAPHDLDSPRSATAVTTFAQEDRCIVQFQPQPQGISVASNNFQIADVQGNSSVVGNVPSNFNRTTGPAEAQQHNDQSCLQEEAGAMLQSDPKYLLATTPTVVLVSSGEEERLAAVSTPNPPFGRLVSCESADAVQQITAEAALSTKETPPARVEASLVQVEEDSPLLLTPNPSTHRHALVPQDSSVLMLNEARLASATAASQRPLIPCKDTMKVTTKGPESQCNALCPTPSPVPVPVLISSPTTFGSGHNLEDIATPEPPFLKQQQQQQHQQHQQQQVQQPSLSMLQSRQPGPPEAMLVPTVRPYFRPVVGAFAHAEHLQMQAIFLRDTAELQILTATPDGACKVWKLVCETLSTLCDAAVSATSRLYAPELSQLATAAAMSLCAFLESPLAVSTVMVAKRPTLSLTLAMTKVVALAFGTSASPKTVISADLSVAAAVEETQNMGEKDLCTPTPMKAARSVTYDGRNWLTVICADICHHLGVDSDAIFWPAATDAYAYTCSKLQTAASALAALSSRGGEHAAVQQQLNQRLFHVLGAMARRLEHLSPPALQILQGKC